MSSFASWGLSVLGLAIIMTVAEMLLPHGKLRKVMRSVFATLTVIAIITPLPSLIKSGASFDFESDTVLPDADYLEYVESAKREMVEQSVMRYLAEQGYGDIVEISVELSGFSVKSATVKFTQSGMSGNDEHINKKEIIGLIAGYLGIGEEAIMSYG